MRTILTLAVLALLTLPGWAAEEGITAITQGNHRDTDPMISPDGHKVAFASNRTGNFNIFYFDYQSGGTFQVTESPDDDRYPNWSPNSKKIVFTSDRTGGGDIFEVDISKQTGFVQLTENESLEEYPSYAPKGEGLLYALAGKRKLLRREMHVAFREGRSMLAAPEILAGGDEPRFSPGGKYIVFVSRRTKNNDIWRMEAGGGLQTQLTSSPDEDETPSFSPKGNYIVFASDRAGSFDLYLMDADGGNVRQLTTGPEDDKQPCWSREDYLYFTRSYPNEGRSHIMRVKAPVKD